MSSSSTQITTIYKSRNVLLEFLEAQGYNISEYLGFSVNEVSTMFHNNQLDMTVERDTRINKKFAKISIRDVPTTTKIYIHYNLHKPLTENSIQEWVTRLFEVQQLLTTNDTLVFVIKEDKINDNLVHFIRRLWEDEIYVIVYPIVRLQFNITKHEKVPLHIILPESAPKENPELININRGEVFSVENLRIIHNINDDNQLPKISRSDPVAMAIFMRPGEICQIIRPTKTAITTQYYRICT